MPHHPTPGTDRTRVVAKLAGLAIALLLAGGFGWAVGAAAGPQPPVPTTIDHMHMGADDGH